MNRRDTFIQYHKLTPEQLAEVATWKVTGGDQSGNMTSCCPTLGYFRGALSSVLDKALTLKTFSYWCDTDFGRIEKIDIEDVA